MNKIESAYQILRLADKDARRFGEPVEIAYSGGKDSDVLLQLARESGINYRAIYKNTTIDPKGTLQHVKQNGVEILQPKRSFFDIIKKKGFPMRNKRFCCAELKEYKVLNVCCTGVRVDESSRRAKNYKTFNYCKIHGKEHTNMYLPIWDWTLKDVADFVKARNLKLAPCYYTHSGEIDFSRRLGCVGCPLQSDRGKKDFKENPAMLKAWIRAGVTYTHTHTLTNFNGNIYNVFYRNLFCESFADYQFKTSVDLFGNSLNCKSYLETYFNVKFNE